MNRLWFLMPILGFTAGSLSGWLGHDPDDLLCLNVGQGDCTVLRHDGVAVMIDDGPEAGDGRAVRAALRRTGVSSVDLVLLSHPDADHVGGTAEVLREFGRVRIAMSAQFRGMPKFERDLGRWGLGDSDILWLPPVANIRFGACDLRVECPPLASLADDNAGSMFVKVSDGGATADFSGDAPASVERGEASHGGWHADMFHVGHHGSRTSTCDTWLDAVRPSIAVISCGRNNPFGHPHQAVLDRLATRGITIYRTDVDGDLEFTRRDGHFQRQR